MIINNCENRNFANRQGRYRRGRPILGIAEPQTMILKPMRQFRHVGSESLTRNDLVFDQCLAMRREIVRICAMRTHATALAIVPSKCSAGAWRSAPRRRERRAGRARRGRDGAARRLPPHPARRRPGAGGRQLLAWRALTAGSAGQWRLAIGVAAEVLGVANDEALQAAVDAAEACLSVRLCVPGGHFVRSGRDSVGIPPPKIAPKSQGQMGGRKSA